MTGEEPTAVASRIVHPIERLRYVARSSGASQQVLVRETAGALAALGFDPPGLVTACRRILDRHPLSGPLWWLSARVLTSNDSNNEAWNAADDITADDTGDVLAYAIPDESVVCVLGWPDVIGDALPRRGDVSVLVVDALGEGSGLVRRLLHADVDADDVAMAGLGAAVTDANLVLLEATAIGPTGFIGVAGSRAAAATATHGACCRGGCGTRSSPGSTRWASRGSSTTSSCRSISSTASPCRPACSLSRKR